MTPHTTECHEIAAKKDFIKEKEKPIDVKSKENIIVIHMIFLAYYHVAAIYGLYLCLTSVKWATIGFGSLMYFIGIFGITAGAHRLWSHRSYKAKMPLQVILMVFQTIAFQKTIITWARDHRLHHKYSDTAGDPHNANNGFFYSHMGWLMTKRPDEVSKGAKCLDMSDLEKNPLLSFQKKYIFPMVMTLCFVLPTIIPMYFWSETLNNAWHANVLRFVVTLNATCCVNSVAHKWGYKPYDKDILPAQNPLLSVMTLGEGYHNYHHVFPWDYQTAELGNSKLNTTTLIIDFFSWIGWAYDLKTASEEVVKSRLERTGDGTDLWGAMSCNKSE